MKALISGIRGQDGQLLATELISADYKVIGTSRGQQQISQGCEEGADDVCVQVFQTDYSSSSLGELIDRERPTEIYNLAGQAYVGKSWLKVEESLNSVALLTTRLLEAIRIVDPSIRFFQASSSQIYAPSSDPLTEESRMSPNTPYGCSKAYAHYLVQSYRETHGIFAVNGILFNHESPRRKSDFFLQKVVLGAVAISRGEQEFLDLGDLGVSRDMGCAGEFMKAAALMLGAEKPSDYNICTGVATNLGELVDYVFMKLGISARDHLRTNRNFVRRYEAPLIVGDNSKIEREIGWSPKRSIYQVIDDMIGAVLES